MNASLKIGGVKLSPLAPVFSPFTGFWQQADAVSSKKQLESVHISCLEDKVDGWYDEHMIPHIFAQNDMDAIRAQGYIEARERLWPMDISTRNAANVYYIAFTKAVSLTAEIADLNGSF